MAATRTDPQWPRLAFSTQAARAILRERHRKEGTERKTARRGVSIERKHARTQHLKGEREKEKERERKREYEEHLEDLASLRTQQAKERKKERKKVCTQRLSFFQNLSKTPPSLDDDALRAGRRPSSYLSVSRSRSTSPPFSRPYSRGFSCVSSARRNRSSAARKTQICFVCLEKGGGKRLRDDVDA